MSAVLAPAVVLTCHPDARSGAVRAIFARVRRMPGALLSVSYCLEGDVARIRLPPERPAHRAERLWEHTCCEMFISREGSTAYHELNFAPSGQWAAYAFTRYRERRALEGEALNPRIAVRRTPARLELVAEVRLERLSPALAAAALALALCSVVEDEDGTLSYWALKHPPGRPDFHHPDAFALELDEVRH